MTHAELHCHTHYSVLDGASTSEEYFQHAKKIGIKAVAQTDHGTVAGWREHQRQAKAYGIKPILGIEAYYTPDRFDRTTAAKRTDGTGVYSHLILLAQNEVGMKNIENLSRIAWTEGYYHKPRMDAQILGENSEGVIALSACMGGIIAKHLEKGNEEGAVEATKQFKDIFEDRFFIELMESNSLELNNKLLDLGKRFDIRPVVTSDSHMATSKDRALTEAMKILSMTSKRRKTPDFSVMAKMNALEAINYLYPDRALNYTDLELYLHTREEHVKNLAAHGIGEEAVDNTLLIADMVGDYAYYEKLDTLPKFPDADDEVLELRRRVEHAIQTKDGGTLDTPEIRERVFGLEIPTIEKLKLSGYFLIEADFVDYANNNDILVGYGRGSAVSYMTNYLLGITGINPMPYNLLPERFLSVDREDPADVDTDFAIDGRYKVKAYAQRKYENVSNIATVGYYRDKSALKAAAKVFGANYTMTQRLLNRVTSIEEFATHPETREYRERYPHVVPMARQLNGKIDKFGIHAGGIILSREPIEKYVPIQTTKDPSDEAAGRVPIAANDMRELADMGFVKYDLLGLRTLSIVDDCIRLIQERHNKFIDIKKIPLDDQNIYRMISEGRTAGLFQVEASASTKTVFDMGGVSNFLELVASNALVRPGAANSTVGETYINGKLTGDVSFIHEEMEEVTRETFGAVLYQEQQLLLCERIAGLSKADANKVRKAVSKKVAKDLAVWKDQFIAGATTKVGAAKAKAIWTDLEASADYAFAKSHAVGYSMLTYLTGYLKYYYPLEFLLSSLNRMTGSKTDRMKTLKYLIEAKRLGIRVVLPHVNTSETKNTIQRDEKGEYILMGLTQIKYIAGKNVAPLMRARPFKNYAEMKAANLNDRVMYALNAVGAAAFPDNPRRGNEKDNYFEFLALPTFETKDIPPRVYAQMQPLLEYNEESTFVTMALVGGDRKKPGWRLIDMVDETATASAFVPPDADIEVGGVYIFLISNNSVVRWITTEELLTDTGGEFQEFLEAQSFPDIGELEARVVAFTSRSTKAGKLMADMVICDEDKEMIGVKVFPQQFPQAHTKCKPGAVVKMQLAETTDGTVFVQGID